MSTRLAAIASRQLAGQLRDTLFAVAVTLVAVMSLTAVVAAAAG